MSEYAERFAENDIDASVLPHPATMHRQPTPGSIAAAEVNLGDVSPEKVQAVDVLMARAREADRANDPSACEQALAEVPCVLN